MFSCDINKKSCLGECIDLKGPIINEAWVQRKLESLSDYAGSSIHVLHPRLTLVMQSWRTLTLCVCQTCGWRETLPRGAKGNGKLRSKGHLVHLETTRGAHDQTQACDENGLLWSRPCLLWEILVFGSSFPFSHW